MNSIAMNLVANMMNTTLSDVNYVSRSEQSTDTSSFKDVIQNTRKGSNLSQEQGHVNTEKNSRRFERSSERVQTQSENKVHKTLQKDVTDQALIEAKDGSATEDVIVCEFISQEDAVTGMEALSLEVIQAIAQLMNVSVEEVQATLQELDMDVEDLFEPQLLLNFVSQQMGLASTTEVLTTEGAMNQYKQVAELVDSVSKAFDSLKQLVNNQEIANQEKSQGQIVYGTDTMMAQQNTREESAMNLSQEESSDTFTSEELEGTLSTAKNEDKSSLPSGFETALNQVVTEKTETVVMQGQVRTIQTQVTAKDVFSQIVTGLKVEVTQGKQDILLQLQPENLGKIAVNISRENGIMTGQFVAESEAVKGLIEKNIPILKQQLEAQGIDLRDVKITVGDSKAFFAGKDSEREDQHFQQTMGQNKKRNMSIDRIGHFINEELEEEVIIEDKNHMDPEINSVEYQA